MAESSPADVAVVVPAWDAYADGPLGEALASVASSRVAVELVVVDNASAVPVEAPRAARVVRSRERVSVGAARNIGLAQIAAPLVVFLDADDLLLPGGLDALVAEIERRPTASAHAMALIEGDTGVLHRVPRQLARRLARWPRLFALAASIWPLLPLQGATIMRTADVQAAGGYSDRSTGEDWALAVALAWRGRISFGKDPVLVYRWRADSAGRSSAARPLLSSARAVRARLRADAATPAAVRLALPLLAAAQLVVIWVVRPAVRALRR